MKMIRIFFLISFIFIFIYYCRSSKRTVTILIGNSFKRFYEIPSSTITCMDKRIKYKCKFINKRIGYFNAVIYNGNRKFPRVTNHSYNIIMTTEKLSQVKFMKDIGEGKNKYYQLAIDYRLFNSKYHISYPIYSYYNLNDFLETAKNNFNSYSSFLKRKNVVYIQRVKYNKRQYLVKELMKYITIDSYGDDLHNKVWPNNISKNNKIDIIKNYKFCLAIENSVITWNIGSKFEAPSINDDYVTEKLTDCLLSGSIPIYFGARNVNLFIPHNDSIINYNNFNSTKELALYINKVIQNSTLIKKHLKWLSDFSKEWFNRFNYQYNFSYCKVCNAIK